MTPRKLVYLATEDWYFVLHRLPMARAARDAGFEVIVATREREHGGRIRAEGLRLVPLPWRRRGNPIGEAAAMWRFWRLLRRERPALVHLIALKAIVYGGPLARLAGVPARVATVAGLGFAFTAESWRARLLRVALRPLLRLGTGGSGGIVTFENADDGRVLAAIGAVPPERQIVVRGSGLDIERFSPAPEPAGVPVIAMACRLVRGKGVGIAVAAVRILRERGMRFRFRLAGMVDPDSMDSHSEAELASWVGEGLVEWQGWIDDVPEFWRTCHVAVYPSSYGEGVPRTSLEAMACGRPLVTTDMPGCRDTVTDGLEGFLVPPRDPEAVADRLARLIADPALRARMGTAARAKVVAEFSDERFVTATMAVYRRVLGEAG